MTSYEEMVKNMRMYIDTPPSFKLDMNRFFPHRQKVNHFCGILTNSEGTFHIEVEVSEDSKMLRYQLSFLHNEIGIIKDRPQIAAYLIKSNSDNKNDLCFAGLGDNNMVFVEIRHNYEIFPIDYKQIRAFEDICIKRLNFEAENIKKLFG